MLGARILAVNNIDNVENGGRLKCVKPKAGRSESKKLSKSQKLAKSRKKSLKSENSPNFNAKDKRPNFLTLETRVAFNRL